MDIPINAKVNCADGECGRSIYVIVNPVTQKVTHLVVKEKLAPHSERLVPVKWIDETGPDMVLLKCDQESFTAMSDFVETEYLWKKLPDYKNLAGGYLLLPFSVPQVAKTVEVKHRRIPFGELAVKRGAAVYAADGHVGQVDEFLVDPEDSHITHLVMQEGHLWGQKEVTFPISEIDRIDEDGVHLKLDKRAIEALPTIPIHRNWR
jgi:sporulation protein YlmC with PRC-barrel domain